MTDGVSLPQGKQTFLDPATGELLAFGRLYHYIPGTGTPKTTYQDEGLTVANPLVITLDAGGQCVIWGSGLYRQILERADGTTIWDQVTGFVSAGGGGSVNFASPAEVAALLSTDKVISPYALGASGVLGGGGGGAGFYPQFTALGGVGNGDPSNPATGTDNSAAFTAALSNASSRIWLADGVFRTTGGTGLRKFFDGPGRIYNSPSGEVLPGRYTYLTTPPAQFPTQGIGGWFAGQLDFIEAEAFVIGANCRHSITDRYFEATTIPHNRWFISYGGSSSVIAHIAAPVIAGDTTVTLDSVDGLTVGDTFGFASGYGATSFADKPVISNINPGTKVVTFAPPLGAGYSAGGVVTLAARTNNPFRYLKATNYGAGDFYGDVARVVQSYPAKAGQTHFFETSTVGQYGGDINFTTDGGYATGWESQYLDQGHDVAVIGRVDSFVRDNDTGARSTVWLGTFQKSEGSKPADASFVTAGKWRVGLDTVRADLTNYLAPGDNYNAAINTALGHRWIMNSTASPGGRGGSLVYGQFYGNLPGDMFIESGNDGTSDFIALRFNRGAGSNGRIRLRPDSMNVNVQANFGAAVNVATDVILGAGNMVEWGAGSNQYLHVSAGKLYWFNGSTDTYIAG